MEKYDLFIIGAGAAGIAAAKAAWKEAESQKMQECWYEEHGNYSEYADYSKHVDYSEYAGKYKIALCDKGPLAGGVLRQCFHRGFGHQQTGVEYADQLLEDFPEEITCFFNSTVLKVTEEKTLLLSSAEEGLQEIAFDHLILASGCMEVPAGALPIAGTRPKGIYTAGEMQAMMHLEGFIPEGPVVILGSGDLGLIMAETIRSAGVEVTLVEQKDSCGGLVRNRKPVETGAVELITGASILMICGNQNLESVILAEGPGRKEGRTLPCKTLLIAAGLRPDRQLVRGLEEKEWLTLCGNCRQVHPMVEGVVAEGAEAGMQAVKQLARPSVESAR